MFWSTFISEMTSLTDKSRVNIFALKKITVILVFYYVLAVIIQTGSKFRIRKIKLKQQQEIRI